MSFNLKDKIIEFWVGVFLSSLGLVTSGITIAIIFISNVQLDELLRSNLINILVAV